MPENQTALVDTNVVFPEQGAAFTAAAINILYLGSGAATDSGADSGSDTAAGAGAAADSDPGVGAAASSSAGPSTAAGPGSDVDPARPAHPKERND